MPTPVLTTLAAFKAHLKVSGTAEDALLEQLLLELDEVVASVTGRERVPGRHPFESVAATEYYDGSGRLSLVLRRRPVTAVAAVKVDQSGYYGQGPNAFPAGSARTLGEHYAVPRLDATEQNGALIESLCGVWPEGQGNVLVTYTAGYATIPADLSMAVHLLGNEVYRGLEKGGILAGETFGKYAYRLLGEAENTHILAANSILARYHE